MTEPPTFVEYLVNICRRKIPDFLTTLLFPPAGPPLFPASVSPPRFNPLFPPTFSLAFSLHFPPLRVQAISLFSLSLSHTTSVNIRRLLLSFLSSSKSMLSCSPSILHQKVRTFPFRYRSYCRNLFVGVARCWFVCSIGCVSASIGSPLFFAQVPAERKIALCLPTFQLQSEALSGFISKGISV